MRTSPLRNAVTAASVLAILTAAAAGGGEPRPVTGRTVAVTLYRGQALVTREVPVDVPAGRVQVVVGPLPRQVLADSLFAEAGKGIDVRAVRLRARAVGEDPAAAVRKLDAEIEAVQEKTTSNRKMQEMLKGRSTYLDRLERFTAATADVELSKGVLNADVLKKITIFSFDQRQAAAKESLKLAGEARALSKQLSLLQRKRTKLTAGASRTVREAVLFLEKRARGKTTLRLSYLVSGAGWSPVYNFRAGKDRKNVSMEYNAIIHQMSGENWDRVALTLSTASPALSAQGPGLASFRVALSRAPGRFAPRQGAQVSGYLKQARGRQLSAERGQRYAQKKSTQFGYNWEMNKAADDWQNLELVAGKDALRHLRVERTGIAQGPSVSYRLPGTAGLPSRSDQQMVRISELKLPGKFYHVATPVLTSYVYREAELTNTGPAALLAGSVSVYLEGRFVGRGEIPTVARGQTFVVGFGADSQLRARRELAEKTERVQGGNREVNLRYRLVLENYKEQPAAVRLTDRLPVSERKTDLRVTLGEMKKDKLSEDKLYLRLERPKGILRWDVKVPARAAGEKARIVEYSYRLEHDRSLHLTAPAGARQGERRLEFQKLQDARGLK